LIFRYVDLNYYGALKNGTMVENYYDRNGAANFTIGVGRWTAGINEGLLLLHHGGKAYFFIPPALGYGSRDYMNFPANSELIYYVEIL
jgi:FKBP-type peptidyl-prolyl cis-trans isomerase